MGRSNKFERITRDVADTSYKIFLFIALSGLLWFIANDFSVSQPEGFDPLRYEYFARIGLPPQYYGSSSYRIVLLLQFLYQYLPYYVGYLVFIGILSFFVRYLDIGRVYSLAIFSPVSFYYFAQTGKDGLAILALIATAIIAKSKISPRLLFYIAIFAICLYIRPPIILLATIVFIQFRFGTFWAMISSFFVIYAFSFNVDIYDVMNTLESLALDEYSGQSTQFIRAYTFGYSIQAIFLKFLLFSISFLFQPFLGIIKFYSGSDGFVLYESLCYLIFLFFLLRKKILIKFFISSLPYVVILAATTPFYHFRYLAIVYPVIYAYSLMSRNLAGRPNRRYRPDNIRRSELLN